MLRPATPSDLPAVAALLAGAGLPLDGLGDGGFRLLVLERDGKVAGAVGYEAYGRDALLRSLVLHPSLRGHGEGGRLLDAGVAALRAAGLRDAWGLTTSIPDLLARRGWTEVPRSRIPAAVHASAELRGACPDSARAFHLPL